MKLKILMRFIIVIVLVLVVWAVIIYAFIKAPLVGEYHVVEFNESKKLSEEDYNTLCDILNSKYEMENIEIHKIASIVELREDSAYYIFFKSNNFNYKNLQNDRIYNIYNKDGIITERVLYHISTFDETEYRRVKKICLKYYKFWENNEKKIDTSNYVKEEL